MFHEIVWNTNQDGRGDTSKSVVHSHTFMNLRRFTALPTTVLPCVQTVFGNRWLLDGMTATPSFHSSHCLVPTSLHTHNTGHLPQKNISLRDTFFMKLKSANIGTLKLARTCQPGCSDRAAFSSRRTLAQCPGTAPVERIQPINISRPSA